MTTKPKLAISPSQEFVCACQRRPIRKVAKNKNRFIGSEIIETLNILKHQIGCLECQIEALNACKAALMRRKR